MKMIGMFSGIGGLELGIHKAFSDVGLELETVLLCEQDPFASLVLKRHFPGVPIHPDVRTLDKPPPSNLLCMGFPCQDASIANQKGKGVHGERTGLFEEGLRVANASEGCNMIIMENVSNIRNQGLGHLCRRFFEDGWNIEWTMLTAAGCGAPHLRRRWFAVATRQHSAWSPVLHANQHTFVCVDRRQAKEGLWVNGKPLMVIKPVGGNEQFFDQGNPLFPGLFRSVPKDREKREQRKWPTPRAGKVAGDSVARFKRAKSEGLVHTPPLETAVWMAESTRFPTPLKNDYKGVGPLGSKSHFHKLTRKTNICALAQESVQQTGKLNPDWVERVMGFEFGYTKTEGPPQREPFMDWGHLKPLNQISAWECNVPRVITKGGKNRTKRIKVLGNAVVPAVAHKFMKTILNNQQQGD